MQATTVAVPRLAATVLLLANSRDLGLNAQSPLYAKSLLKPNDIHVLMVRRHNKARFMPEMYVFPGGGVDPEDCDVVAEMGFMPSDATSSLSTAQEKQLRETWSSRIAALRELSEETSCVLRGDETIESVEDWNRRDMGTANKRSFDATAAPRLTPLGHWITPEDNKYRYDTYFYGAALRADGTRDGLPPQLVKLQNQEREISNLLWVSPLEALLRHELPDEAFTLPPPTFHLLSALARMPSFEFLAGAWRARRDGLPPTAMPEEMTFDPITPGSLSKDHGKDVVYFQIPEKSFHNMGPEGALKAGHYSMPSRGTNAEGKTNYVDLYVGDIVTTSSPRRITFLKD